MQDFIQAVKALVPQPAVRSQPIVELTERLGSQVVDPLLSGATGLDDAGVTQHAQVLGDLGLAELQPVNDRAHGAWPTAQEFDYLPAGGLGQGAQRRVHVRRIYPVGYMLVKEYSQLNDGCPGQHPPVSGTGTSCLTLAGGLVERQMKT